MFFDIFTKQNVLIQKSSFNKLAQISIKKALQNLYNFLFNFGFLSQKVIYFSDLGFLNVWNVF